VVGADHTPARTEQHDIGYRSLLLVARLPRTLAGAPRQIFDPLSRTAPGHGSPGCRCRGRAGPGQWRLAGQRVGLSGPRVGHRLDVGYLEQLDLPNLEVVQHNILETRLTPSPGSLTCLLAPVVVSPRRPPEKRCANGAVSYSGWLADRRGRRRGTTLGHSIPRSGLSGLNHDAWRNGGLVDSARLDPVFGRKLQRV